MPMFFRIVESRFNNGPFIVHGMPGGLPTLMGNFSKLPLKTIQRVRTLFSHVRLRRFVDEICLPRPKTRSQQKPGRPLRNYTLVAWHPTAGHLGVDAGLGAGHDRRTNMLTVRSSEPEHRTRTPNPNTDPARSQSSSPFCSKQNE